MSLSQAAHLSRGKFNVVVVGGTGNLGSLIATTLLTTYSAFFRTTVTTRDTNSPAALSLSAAGAQIEQLTDYGDEAALDRVLQGADILIDSLGRTTGGSKDALPAAALRVGARVYIPSEFGADHRFNDFPGYDHPGWIRKREHIASARELAAGRMKIIAIYAGLFLEDSITPNYGFNISGLEFTAVGAPTSCSAYTTKADVARAIAELSLLALSPTTASTVPDNVRLAGSIVSMENIAQWTNGAGATRGEPGAVEIKSIDLLKFKESLKATVQASKPIPITEYIRILMGEGKLDWTTSNENELVNPGEQIWKWTAAEEMVKGVKP